MLREVVRNKHFEEVAGDEGADDQFPRDVLDSFRNNLRPKVLGFDDGTRDELREEEEVEADVAHPFGEATSLGHEGIAFAGDLTAGDINDHADAVKGIERDADGQGDGLERINPCSGQARDHAGEEREILEDTKQREVHDHGEAGPVLDACLITGDLVEDDAAGGDAVADAGYGEQADELGILPAVKDHTRHKGQHDLPCLAMAAKRPRRVIKHKGNSEKNEEFPRVEEHGCGGRG